MSHAAPQALSTGSEGDPVGQHGRLLAHALPPSPLPFEAAAGEEAGAHPGMCCSPMPWETEPMVWEEGLGPEVAGDTGTGRLQPSPK